MPRDFEEHCWKDVIDADTLQIYQAYRRKTYVGDNPAVLAIDLYNKAYRGGDRPVKEVDREFSGSCGEHAWKAMAPTQKLFAAARRAGVPVIYTTRHVDTRGVQSTYRNIGGKAEDVYDIKAELAPQPGETEGFSPHKHLEVLAGHAPALSVDVVLADTKAAGTGNLADLEKAAAMLGARLMMADVAAADGTPRHDPRLLAGMYAQIFRGE